MPTYNGSDLAKVIPERHVKNYPEITDDQAKGWWEAFSAGVAGDPRMGIKFDEGRNLYLHTDDHRIIRAVNEGESLDTPAVQRRLLENSLNGRLFTRQGGDAWPAPRQVVTDPADLSMGVAIDSSAYTMPRPEEPIRPAVPPFWKYLLWPFSSSVREEFRTYQEEKQAYDTVREKIRWIDNFSQAELYSDIITDDKAADMPPASYADQQVNWEQRAEMERQAQLDAKKEAFRNEHDQRKQEWNKDISTMSIDEYQEYGKQLRQEAAFGDPIRNVVGNSHSTYEDVLDGVVRLLEGSLHATVRLFEQHYFNIGMPEMVALQQPTYQKAKEGLRDYARKMIDENLIKDALESHEEFSEATDKLVRATQELKVEEYANSKGLITDFQKVPHEMLTKASELKHRNVGQEGMKQFADSLKGQMAQQATMEVQQAQPQPEPPKPVAVSGPPMG